MQPPRHQPPPAPQSLSLKQGLTEDARPLLLVAVCGLALVVGIVTGLGAVVFRGLIGLVHNFLFLGHCSFAYDASLFTPPSPWGAWVILVPVVGALGVTFIVSTFAPEAKGHGVPEVMDAIYYKRGVIRPVVAVVKSLASALAIGSGAAVGREGPIIQIGSALGSTLGQVDPHDARPAHHAGRGRRRRRHRRDLQYADRRRAVRHRTDDAGNQRQHLPAGGDRDRHGDLHRPAVLRRPAGVLCPRRNLAPLPAEPSSALTLLLYACSARVIGAAAALFRARLHWAEDRFDKIPGRYLRHALGMLLVGVLIYALMR